MNKLTKHTIQFGDSKIMVSTYLVLELNIRTLILDQFFSTSFNWKLQCPAYSPDYLRKISFGRDVSIRFLIWLQEVTDLNYSGLNGQKVASFK